MASEHHTKVLVVGAGPAGLIAAWQLSRHGVPCMIAERNLDTTKWPKMDITNCRSMELLRRLELADGLRNVGVPQNFSFDVLFSTSLSDEGEVIGKWDLPSPDVWRDRILKHNDGTQPREPYQRCSQAIFEAWLKPYLIADATIDARFGWKLESLDEADDGVTCQFTDVTSGEKQIVHADYVVGCDGSGSRVRRSMGGSLSGGPAPRAMFLVHFKSKDLARLHRQGQFWHIFFTNGAVIISQDEKDTWTCHLPIPPDLDTSTLDPTDVVYRVLGGSAGPYEIKVDEILVTSSWRPSIYIADRYRSPGGRMFLSGDACHQNIPTGGYGMNTAVGDSFDIGWKLAHTIRGMAGPFLLDSYERERLPIGARNIERSGAHASVHQTYVEWVMAAGSDVVLSPSPQGQLLRQQIAQHVAAHDGENQDHGIELGHRYTNSPVIVPDREEAEPPWNPRDYFASTWPGARAPHVFLSDGSTSIFDTFGRDYTCVDFTQHGRFATLFEEKATELHIDLKVVRLPQESHARSIWGRDAVLIRPDDHVAWRANLRGDIPEDIEHIWNVVVGRASAVAIDDAAEPGQPSAFAGTIGQVSRDKVQLLDAFE